MTFEERKNVASTVGYLVAKGKVIRFNQLFLYMTKKDWADAFNMSAWEFTKICVLLRHIPVKEIRKMAQAMEINPGMLDTIISRQLDFDKGEIEENNQLPKKYVFMEVRYPTPPLRPVRP